MENKNYHVNKIFALEKEMLLSIESHISSETKNKIIDKMKRQENILLDIANNELQTKEKIKRDKNPRIDDNYFDKKHLNINNI